jgi:alpha-ketoglutarate-dependent taurine dioxygenase
LPEERKAELDGLRAVHGVWPTVFYYDPEPSLAKLKGMQGVGENELPLVWNHKNGRKSLVIGCTTLRVLGKSDMESAQIIHGLREWATQEEFSYSHEWTVGDLVIWDNTGTMHRAEQYDLNSGRMMHRTKLEGEEPFE